MARIEKTIFISYRRTDVYTALAVYENLKNQGYDVFFDYRSISSGDFEQIITSNIRARAHFLLVLTPTALDRCNEPGDWLRREIEIAINEKRNIVPLFFKGFRFGIPAVSKKLTGKLKDLSRYNGLNVHEDYFDEAMHRLSAQYLNIPLDTVLHPVSTLVQKVVREEQVAADKALEQIEDVQELVKHDEKPVQLVEPAPMPDLKTSSPVATSIEKQAEIPLAPVADLPIQSAEIQTKPDEIPQEKVSDHKPAPKKAKFDRKAVQNLLKQKISIPNLNFRLVGGIVGGTLLLAISVWGLSRILINPPVAMTGKDGMTLLYVPAGEFTMGSDSNSDEQPIHKVTLDAFWIDKTEVTVRMYTLCVEAGACTEPTNKNSWTHSSYYGNAEFDNYPVIYVNWNMAKTYCEWAGRRLPTEAEWEKAARGKDENIYPWGNGSPNANLLNYNSNIGDTAEVGSYLDGASIYGALDMAGNVWEWVSSSELSYPYDPADGRENLSSSSDARVLRGGTWRDVDGFVRSAYRDSNDPTASSNYIGFRCAVSANRQADITPLAQASTNIPSATQTSQPTKTDTPSPTETLIPATPTLSIGSKLTGKDDMTLLYVPAGEFMMGSEDGGEDEQPVHLVYLDAFWLDKTEVTNKMYSICVEAGVCKEPTNKSSPNLYNYYGNNAYDNYPVIYVDWTMAKTYCEWVGRRLTTEAEWEKAARGSDGRIYPWGNEIPSLMRLNYNNAEGGIKEVGQYPDSASPYGALDMAGNVWEWVEDWYDASYYATLGENARNPQGPANGQYRVLRGGSWYYYGNNVRSAYRWSLPEFGDNHHTGFRCAMDATP